MSTVAERTDIFVCLACGDPADDGSGNCPECKKKFADAREDEPSPIDRFDADFYAIFGGTP